MGRKILLAVIGLGAAATDRRRRHERQARAREDRVQERGGEERLAIYQTEDYAIRVASIVSGLSHPWSLAFLPGRRHADYRTRAAHCAASTTATSGGSAIAGTPRVHSTDQEGLLDIALHPQFAQNHLLYFTYSKEGPGGTTIALARGRLEGDALPT